MLQGALSVANVPKELRSLAIACPEALTDEELMLLLQNSQDAIRSEDLFGEIFRRYHSRVVTWCFRVARDRTLATDLAQEVFLKASRHLHNFRGDSRLSTWLYVIARNHCLSALKKSASDPLKTSEAVPLRLADPYTVEPDMEIHLSQIRRKVRQVMDANLEPLEARVMELHYGYEMPLTVITQRLALSNPSGAKAYIVNARRKLSNAIRRGGLNSGLRPACKSAA
jgi:RNA polymerase sigma-70 factor (ECF subfamily)